MNKKQCQILFVCILLTKFACGQSSKFTSIKTGDWDDPTVWTESGTDADDIPDEDDTVEIQLGHVVTCTNTQSSRICKLINEGELALNSTYPLYVYGNNTTSINNGLISGSGAYYQVRTGTLAGTGTIPNGQLKSSFGTLTLDCNISINNSIVLTSSGKIVINSGRSLSVSSFVIASSGCRVTNNGSITVTSTSFLLLNSPASTSFYSSNGSIIWNTSQDLVIPADGGYDDVTILTSTSCNGDFTVGGDWVNNATFTSSAGNTITFNGTSIQEISGSAGVNNFANLTLNNSNGLSLGDGTLGGDIFIDEVMKSTSGTFNLNGVDLVLKSTTANKAGMIKLNASSDFTSTLGNFTIQRYYNATSNGWRMVSAPIVGGDLQDYDDEFIYCGFSGGVGNFSLANCGGFYSVYTYNESLATPALNNGFQTVTSLSQSISEANGTLIYTSLGATNLSATGNPYFNSFTKAITKTNDGWNLVSNPYPATLDWSTFYAANNSGASEIDDVFYVYEADQGGYKTVMSGSQNIPHCQGFWVKKTNGGAGNLTFNVNQTTDSDADFIKSVNGINFPLELKITGDVNSFYDNASILADPVYTNNYDPGKDIYKLLSPDPDNVPNLFFVDGQGRELHRTCINNNQSVDLFLEANIGSNAPGNYTISFENISKFMIGSCLYIEDLHNGIITDLRSDSLYTFLSDTNAVSPRFKIHINVDYDIQVNNPLCFGDSTANISLFGNGIQGSYFNLLDSVNNSVDSIFASGDSINFLNIMSGIYTINTNHVGSCAISSQHIVVVDPLEVNAEFSTLFDTLSLDENNEVNVVFKNLSTGSLNYLWDFDNGITSNQINPSNIYTNQGIYSVKLTATNDILCEDVKAKNLIITDHILTEITENRISDENYMLLNGKMLEINPEFLDKLKSIFIYSSEGKLIYSSNSIKSSVDLSGFINGIYIVVLNEKANNSYIKKISL